MHTDYTIVGFRLFLPKGQLPSDRVYFNASEELLQLVERSLNEAWSTLPEGGIATISPIGPMLAVPEDAPAQVIRLLGSAAVFAARVHFQIGAAVAFGSMQLVKSAGIPMNVEGKPALIVARLLSALQPGSLLIHESISNLWTPKRKVSQLQLQTVAGKHEGEKFRALHWPNFFPLLRNDTVDDRDLVSPSTVKIERKAEQLAPVRRPALSVVTLDGTANRFMRRRCREIYGGSKAFRDLFFCLANEKHAPAKRSRYLQQISRLSRAFEKSMAMAAFYEECGKVELMLNELNRVIFTGEEEASRRLMRAIALEKLDKPTEALDDIGWVLRGSAPDGMLIWAAQFNANVCLEKLGHFESVDFERFLSKRDIKLSTGEYLWHKAISMELIVCIRTGKSFKYASLVRKALAEEFALFPSGYVKTLINWGLYSSTSLTKKHLQDVRKLEYGMSPTARAALLHSIMKTVKDRHLNEDLRASLIDIVETTGSEAVRKFVDPEAE